MSDKIHSTAIIFDGAEVGENVEIGPYCVIGPNVKLGDGCILKSHVSIDGHTTIGKKNKFFPFSSIGAEPQDYSYNGEPTKVQIGDGNTFRECVTVNCGTLKQDGITIVGNDCLLMAYVHLGHDVVMGNKCTIANAVNVAGHVYIQDNVIIGGGTDVAQFISLGKGSYIGGGSGIDRDIPPFCTAMGNRIRLKGINIVGMKRLGIDKKDISGLVDFFRSVETSGMSPRAYVENVEIMDDFSENKIVDEVSDFIKSSKIGIAPFLSLV